MSNKPLNNGDAVHFIGSVCLPDTTATFRRLSNSLPGRLRRLPDGEPGKRRNFVVFQRDIFNESPFVQAPFPPGSSETSPSLEPTTESPPIKLLPLEYDDFALASYGEFSKLRAEGIIPQGVRFQVSLPTPVNVLGNLVKPAWMARVEPLYEDALLTILRNIQDNIPAHDLAIQWDMASEFAYLEGAASSPAWFSPVKEGLVQRVLKCAAAVDRDVSLGFHLCYGDLGHKHFVEPKDTALLVEFANMLSKGVQRPVDWFHMPVPKSRLDLDYFSPLKGLQIKDAELFLGLLHPRDEKDTRSRIDAASRFVTTFGLATECGLGRSSEADLDSILDIASKVKGPRRELFDN
ncbi:MAG: hypothetical protein Q9190_005223 [Brigantiaea leucoxantha]